MRMYILTETMGLEPGSSSQGQMVAALKRLGFERTSFTPHIVYTTQISVQTTTTSLLSLYKKLTDVFDTNYSADLT